MPRNFLLKVCGACFFALVFSSVAAAEVKLPAVFGDQMVLQRDMPIPVWGWADPGESVTVRFAGQSQTVAADDAGKWSVKLDPLAAGGPHELTVQGANVVRCADVLVGEVWLCSGQSNMQMTVGASKDREAEVAAADYPAIRMFTVQRKTAQEPQADCKGAWQACSPKTAGGFSAAAYFFGRELHKQLGVPVGLVHASWGGTPIEAWISIQTQETTPELAGPVQQFHKAVAAYDPEAVAKEYEKATADWEKAKAEAKDDAQRAALNRRRPSRRPDPRFSQYSPGRLYNGMIAPLAPFALRGAIWYQGESNAKSIPMAKLYGLQLRALIAEWRALWGQGDFPFISVQLPNYLARHQAPVEPENGFPGWPMIREQFLQSLSVPNAGMVVAIDLGEADDIHPKNKQEVGRRLALWALHKTYGKDNTAGGPLYKAMRVENGAIVVSFDHLDGGLVARDGEKLKGFAIAGPDKKFVWADARIEGDAVVVSSPEVKSPAAVRYAWAINPECNLMNKAGLPASPFRTDDWSK